MSNPLTVLFRADPTYRNPRAQQGSFGIEHEFSPGFSVSAGYVWALTQYITRARDINLRNRPIGPRGQYGLTFGWSGHGCLRDDFRVQASS